MTTLRDEFFERGRVDDCPIYDLHGHMGPFYGAQHPWSTPDAAIRAMDRANVRMLAFCHHAALFSPDIGNQANVTAVRAAPQRFRAYCAVNPNYPDLIERDVQVYAEFPDVFVGFKMHGEFHGIPITDKRLAPAWELADSRGLLVLVHTWGGSPVDGEGLVREVAGRYRGAKILMGHSIHGHWGEAIRLVRDFANVYYDLCAVLDERGVVEDFVAATGSNRILFGSDFPWFDFHYNIGALLGTKIGEDDLRNIFYRNARRLLAL